jgi:hypothetical protein
MCKDIELFFPYQMPLILLYVNNTVVDKDKQEDNKNGIDQKGLQRIYSPGLIFIFAQTYQVRKFFRYSRQ